MKNLVEVKPFNCRMWNMHDRHELQVTEETCSAEIKSFARHGQLIPVLGRTLKNDPTHKVELIYGARRLFVARHLNLPLLVELREITDREAIIAMDIENRQRSDISPYERGVSYSRWLRAGYFQNQEEIAQALRISASQVSRLSKLAQLPPVVVAAFDSPAAICEGWGLDIMKALEEPSRRQATIAAARSLSRQATRPAPCDVYRQLLNPEGNGRRPRAHARDEVVKDPTGKPLFRIRNQRSAVAFLLPMNTLAPEVRDEIRHAIREILQKRSGTIRVAGVEPDLEAVPEVLTPSADLWDSRHSLLTGVA
jgi:ParB/RepB/Spo0J family partition protein